MYDACSVSGLNICTGSETSGADPGIFIWGGGEPIFGSEGTVLLNFFVSKRLKQYINLRRPISVI